MLIALVPLLALEYVSGRVCDAPEIVGLLATAAQGATMGVEPLNGCHAGEQSVALMFNHIKLEPRNIFWRGAGRVAYRRADDLAPGEGGDAA